MKVISISAKLFWLVLLVLLPVSHIHAQLPGFFEAYTSAGVIDIDGQTYLKGDPLSGDLVQIIWAGANGIPDPADSLGNTTVDDSLLGTTHIGYGFPDPSQHDRGLFVATLTHELFVAGTAVFVRAWNDSVVLSGSDYGDSQVYTLQSNYDSHDFGQWFLIDRYSVPVELVAFEAKSRPGVVELSWSTASETENLGFYIYRSEKADGIREKITENIINGAINSESKHDYSWEDRPIEGEKTYYYWLADISTDGKYSFHGPKEVASIAKPDAYALDQNYPNPFNPSTNIRFRVKEDGVVNLTIHNITGQLIRVLVNSNRLAGEYTVKWDGRDRNGVVVPSGTYLYTINVNDFQQTRKMIFTK